MGELFRPDHRNSNDDLPSDFDALSEDQREALIKERLRLLHIYAQDTWHGQANIVGNRCGLLVLRDAIDDALVSGKAETTAMVKDGEGFGVTVKLNDAAWESPSWQTTRTPYIDPIANGAPDPFSEVVHLRAALRKANAALFARGGKPIPDPTKDSAA